MITLIETLRVDTYSECWAGNGLTTACGRADDPWQSMTTIRSDVLVLGSTLGGLIAATYLARAGLRVTLFEEDTHDKRLGLLREPFLLTGR